VQLKYNGLKCLIPGCKGDVQFFKSGSISTYKYNDMKVFSSYLWRRQVVHLWEINANNTLSSYICDRLQERPLHGSFFIVKDVRDNIICRR